MGFNSGFKELKRSVVIHYHYHYRVGRDMCVCVCMCLTWQQRCHIESSLLRSLPSENIMAKCVRWPQSSPHSNDSLVSFICVQSFILGVFNFPQSDLVCLLTVGVEGY